MIQATSPEPRYRDGMNAAERAVKRLFDILVSLAGLVLLSPLMLYIAARVRCSGGPVIYRQERIGHRGRPFTILKFRTMRPDHEHDGVPQLAVQGEPDQTDFQRFLREHGNFMLEPVPSESDPCQNGMFHSWTHLNGNDGFFAAKLKKT